MKLLGPLYVALIALFASTSFAEEQADGASASSSPAASHGVDLNAVISSVSQRTHRKFLIGPGVHASVNLVGIEPREVSYAQLMTILAVHELAAYDREGVIVVIPDTNERQIAPGPGGADVAHALDDEVVTSVIEVKSGRAIALVPVLRPLMPQQAQLQAVADHNALIIVDRAANVRRITALVHELDKMPVMKADIRAE